jgi:hypothetical protein
MELGYVKTYRSLAEKGYSNKPEFLALWIHLLFLATYKEREVFFDNKIHHLKPGQIITGRKKLSAIAGIEEHKVDRILKCFESEQQIEQQSFSKFRIITICNWDKYQQSEQQIEQEMSNKWATSEQQVSTYNKDKKDKKEKKYISDLDFYNGLKETYSWVDFDAEIKKIDFWIANHPGRKKTRSFIMRWFAKIEKPLDGDIKKAWNS